MPLIVKSARIAWLPWVAALIPFFVTSAAVIAIVLTDTAPPEEAALPFVAMSIFSIAIFVTVGVPIWLSSQWERRQIRHLRAHAWVSWPQYDSEDSWRDFAQREYQRERAATRLPWGMFIVLVVIFTFVTAFTLYLMNSNGAGTTTHPLLVLLPLGGMFVIIMMMSMGGRLAERRASAARYRRCQRAPIPNVYIGARGLYDDDDGYYAFGGFSQSLTCAQHDSGRMRFTIRMTHWFSSSVLHSTAHKVVRVPRGEEAEAEKVLERLRQERIIRP